MKINKIILTILILSIVTLVFSGCGGWNPIIPPIPEPEPEPIETIIPETTKVVEEETIQEIVSITEDQSTIIFGKSTPQLEELIPGNIIAMGVTKNTPEGLLRKVKNITKGVKDSSEVIVETEFATLEEAIEQGEFYFNEALKAEDAKEPVYYVKGIEFIRDKSTIRDSKIQLLEFTFNINAIIYDGDNNPNTEIDNITLTGQMSFDYNLLLSGKITFFQLKELNFQNIVKVNKKLGVTVGGSVKVFSYEKVLWTQDLGIKIISIGCCFPVVLHPKITISANVDGEIFAELTAEVIDTDIYTAGIQFDNGSWQPISSHENYFSPPSLSLSTGGSVTFGIGPKIECKVDGVVGPYCKTTLYGKVIADIYTNPWWNIYVGIMAKAGVKIEIFSKVFASADLIILDLQKIIKQADGPFGGINHAPVISSLIANPSSININETTAITCIASDEDVGDILTYAWTKNGGTFEGSTSGSTITWKAPSTKGNYTVSCEVSDGEASDSDQVIISVGDVNHSPLITSTPVTSATKGQPYSYDVNAFDPDGDTLAYSLTIKPTGMTINSSTGLITWTPTTLGNYNVTVKVSDGELFDTQSFTVTVKETITTLGQVQLLSPSNGATLPPGNITFSWNSVSNATKYQFMLYNSAGQVALDTIKTGTSLIVALGTEETITWKVRAGDNSGNWGPWSSTWSLTIKSTTTLGQVQLLSPSNGATLPPGNITFSWNSVSNATKYQFILYNQQGQVALDTTFSSTSAIVALGTEETITWKVRAGDNSGNWGAWSSIWSLTLKSTAIINKPDLIVSNVWTEPNPPIAAGYTTIGIEIKNQGNADATGTFFLEFYFDGTYQGHVYINGLTAGSTYTAYWQAVIWPSDTNLHTIKGVVDPDNIINESNESNNQYSIQVKATEPPTGTGTLKIESVPGSAKVYIDGVYKGETPSSGYLTISNLAAGDHNLKVTKSGYKDWIGVVTIPSGSTKYEAVILESIVSTSAIIDNYSPSSKITINTGQSFTISTSFTNTGNTAAYFYAGVSIWNSNGSLIFSEWGGKTYLNKGQQGSASWNHTINTPGEYWLQFGVWDEAKSKLLDKKPSPSQNLIKVVSVSTQIERLTNGSFSSGASGWTLVGDFWAGTYLSNYYTSPGYSAGGVDSTGLPKNKAVGWMYQNVTIPSGATSATFSFWYNITSEETGSTAYDIINVTIQNSTGNYLATVKVLSNLNKSSLGSYKKITFDITPYKGQTVRIHFLATTDDYLQTVFRIDDVSLMSDG